MERQRAALESMALWICSEVESAVRFNRAGSGTVLSGIVGSKKDEGVGDAIGEQEVKKINIRRKIFFMESPSENIIKKFPSPLGNGNFFFIFRIYGLGVFVAVAVAVEVTVGVAEAGIVVGVKVGVLVLVAAGTGADAL